MNNSHVSAGKSSSSVIEENIMINTNVYSNSMMSMTNSSQILNQNPHNQVPQILQNAYSNQGKLS